MNRQASEGGPLVETAIAQSPVGFHVSLNVADLGRSVDFYRKIFGAAPVKERPDYAKFQSTNPPLTLSLIPAGSVGRGGSLNHVGFRLASAAELVELQRRLEMAGLASQRERGVECCYSRQTKFWLTDPDGTLWEFYVLDESVPCSGEANGDAVSIASSRTTVPLRPSAAQSAWPTASGQAQPAGGMEWEHRLGDDLPLPLPFADGSLSEVRLRGTFNVPVEEARREVLFAEVLRVLCPAGRVVLHQLTGNRPLPCGAAGLPGPAAIVREIPVDRELLAWIEEAGFDQIRLIKFGSTAAFEREGVLLREMIIEARKPVNEESFPEGDVTIVYKGPLRELVDDAGRVFRRGERIVLSAAAWNILRNGPLEEFFVRLREEPMVACHVNT
jgi:catechol 2,3-dioxygenase-like lactoylglutathione lyase family enzyme